MWESGFGWAGKALQQIPVLFSQQGTQLLLYFSPVLAGELEEGPVELQITAMVCFDQ